MSRRFHHFLLENLIPRIFCRTVNCFSCIEAFDEFSKTLLSSGPYPHNSLPPVTVFDYHLDFPTGTLLSSTEKLSGKPRVIASSYVVVPRVR